LDSFGYGIDFRRKKTNKPDFAKRIGSGMLLFDNDYYFCAALIFQIINKKFMKIHWRSPSNLAIIKYWGKHGRQLPRNASVSFTLNNAFTETSLEFEEKEKNGALDLEFLFENQINIEFQTKVLNFLQGISDFMPFLTDYKLTFNSHNSFPHSAGIASSASGMSALALCLCSMERAVGLRTANEEMFFRKASQIARLGSGSACRSVYPRLALWGKSTWANCSSDDYAIPFGDEVHDVFHSYHDDILMVSKAKKSVSSTKGHALMDNNPFSEVRYQQAHENMGNLLTALKEGNLKTFGEIAEQEALQLHALMMTSRPSYILMKGDSLEIIKRIREWRKMTGAPLYFSLDAGPNMHLLYPDHIQTSVKKFIESDLLELCEDREYLQDVVGEGAKNLL
jgi:diphosphomevalonate decarboxylase